MWAPRTQRVLAIASAAALALGVVAPAAASGPTQWKIVTVPSGTSSDAYQPALAFDAAGNLTVVFVNFATGVGGTPSVIANAGLKAGSVKPSLTPAAISGPNARQPLVVATSNGLAFAAWLQQTGGRWHAAAASRMSATGGFGAVQELDPTSTGDASRPTVAMASNGNGILAWETNGGSVARLRTLFLTGAQLEPAPGPMLPVPNLPTDSVASAATSSGAWLLYSDAFSSPHRLLLVKRKDAAMELVSTVDPQGGALAQLAIAPGGLPVMAWLRPAASGWDVMLQRPGYAPEKLASTRLQDRLALSVGPKGEILVAWAQPDLVNGAPGWSEHLVVSFTKPGALHAAAPAKVSLETDRVERPLAAFAKDGTAFVAYRSYDGSAYTIRTVVRPPGGSFQKVPDKVNTYWVGTADDVDPALAVDSTGRAVIAYQANLALANGPHARINLAIRPAKPARTYKLLTGLALSRFGFAVGSRLDAPAVGVGQPSLVTGATGPRLPIRVGTRIVFTLAKAATVDIRIDREMCWLGPGQPTPRSTCRTPKKSILHWKIKGKKGLNSVTFLGARGKVKLASGTIYLLRLTAKPAVGASEAAWLGMGIDGPPTP